MKNKIKTMKSRQTVSDEEIQRYMDFDKLLLEKNKVLNRQRKVRYLRYGGIGLLGITLTVSMLFLIPDSRPMDDVELKRNSDSIAIVEKLPERQSMDATEKEPTPIVAAPEDIKKKTQAPSKASDVLQNGSKGAQPVTEKNHESPEGIYIQAEPLNGYPDLYAYFGRELTYPQEAIKDSIQGIVKATFFINQKGRPENIGIENSLGEPFDQEVARVVENMPAWKPASYNGKPVKSKVSLPLTFQLKKVNPKE